MAKVLFLEGRQGTMLCLNQLWDFLGISLFPKIRRLKSFGDLLGNLSTKFIVQEIKSQFTWCELNQTYTKKLNYFIRLFPRLQSNIYDGAFLQKYTYFL